MAPGSTEHGHGHRHEHGYQLQPTTSAEQRWYAQTAEQLIGPPDRLVADIGCGEGAMAIELARVLSTQGKVVALDSDPEVLDLATARISDAGLIGRISTIAHDLTAGIEPLRGVLAGADRSGRVPRCTMRATSKG
ncbi:hypothetical protein BH24ACT9_BH24ACT9_07890 [soil metagenome]